MLKKIRVLFALFFIKFEYTFPTFQMNIEQQITEYITSQPETKRNDMEQLHGLFLKILPNCRLWFLNGKNSENKTVSNPNIGYGLTTLKYANGSSQEFYRIGMSANTSGISIYLMGLNDKTYLNRTFGSTIGKATVTGYCIKFKSVKDIDLAVLEKAVGNAAAFLNN